MSANEHDRQLAAVERLNEIGIALSKEHDEDRVLELILRGAKDLTRADGGTIYSVVDDQALRFRLLRTDSLGLAHGGSGAPIASFPDIPLYIAGAPNHSSVVAHAVLERTTVVIDDAYTQQAFDFSGTRAFDARTGYRSTSMLTVPMRDHRNDIIGVLQLLNAQDDAGAITAFSPHQVRLVESLASQASMLLSNGALARQVGALFESFVKLIAGAIDEKSPYTGKHCRRVPPLTMALAEAAHRQDDGPLADFSMSDDDRYELHIASWLHDCGKITTPEWVMDKATKLQGIHDRLHDIRTRAAVIRLSIHHQAERDIAAGASPSEVRQRESADLADLEDDLAVLERCNQGGEWMDDASIARIHAIAQRTWPDHTGQQQAFLHPAEIENLCIRKGTLLPAERAIINHHIVATIDMLEQLPFPRHLRNVPEIAGGHHERMDGTGYPRGLRRENMSVQARCMGIADVFEALTASDRPYKRAMPLSQALAILADMSTSGHIDPDLFSIFIAEGVWLDYAHEHLDASQIDIDLPSARARFVGASDTCAESP
ncbi:MAG: GAF domain-containing protein [Planctomycetota bacterium]|nr:MAG: GAF domain-containing protein [Planctomycetota bacterium]